MGCIIAYYAVEGLMLPRSHGALQEVLSNYVVADLNGEVVGCGGLEQYSNDTAEIYGLATSPRSNVRGIGSSIVNALIEKARSENTSPVFALTVATRVF